MDHGKANWRLGATSFILPAEISDNVIYLADKVDDVQLLFFESPTKSEFPHNLDTRLLKVLGKDHQLSYTVHLPLDLSLTSTRKTERVESVGEVCRIVEDVYDLSPLCFDLHLDYYQKEQSKEAWLAAVDNSLSLLKGELGEWFPRIAVENINYPFQEIRSLVLEHGMSLCLDFGHAIYYGDDIAQLIADIPQAAHIHYHGIEGNKDHQVLNSKQRDMTTKIGEGMQASDFAGVFTLEVYNAVALDDSLRELAEAWDFLSKE